MSISVNPTTRIRHVQLEYLSSQSWTVSPVTINSLIQGLYMKYSDNTLEWNTTMSITSRHGRLEQDDVINNYVVMSPYDDILPGYNIGMVLKPRVTPPTSSDYYSGFFSTNIPTNNNIGGRVRRNYCIDLQMNRLFSYNITSRDYSCIIGGVSNTIGIDVVLSTSSASSHMTIGGGISNTIEAKNSTIGGGYKNKIITEYAIDSLICGGRDNKIENQVGNILGGYENEVRRPRNTVCGGRKNISSSPMGTIGAGLTNIHSSSSFIDDYAFSVGRYCKYVHGSMFMIGNGIHAIAGSNLFWVRENGRCYGEKSFLNSNADVAEYYETEGERLPVGSTVTFVEHNTNDKHYIRACRRDEIPIGVVSDTAGYILNDPDQWYGMHIIRNVEDTENIYEYNDVEIEVEEDIKIDDIWYTKKSKEIDRQVVTEEVDVLDINTGEVLRTVNSPKVKNTVSILREVRELNPLYDDSLEYIPRSDRDEWHIIGLLGKCRILKNQPVNNRWKLIDNTDVEYDWYLL